jgi:uncharacterized phiE125 gp8 family phage protein
MALVLATPPSVEPVSLAEAKTHLRIDHDAEDALITSLIITSRLHVEAALGLALITQGWSLRLDRWPDDDVVVLPIRPVQSVEAVRVADGDGAFDDVAAETYSVDGQSNPPRLAPAGVWPKPGTAVQGIEIAFSAGYGDQPEDVPQPIRQALLMLIAHWYEHREPVAIGTPAARIPDTISALLSPYRTVRL